MRARIENVFHVTPATFWEVLFFDEEYNNRLYAELGFDAVEVKGIERLPDGRVRRSIRCEPPVRAPDLLKKRIQNKLAYEEEGTYDPRGPRWDFKTLSNVAPESTKISGAITAEPHTHGMLHVVELDITISVFGLGGMIEKVLEKNIRESYRVTTRFTNAFAVEKGLVMLAGAHTIAPRDLELNP
jgi:hypothetical protein